jgi:NAD(P)-dependent dehydrogenase (short-subunit alcohol dehydrogenase family)
MRWALVTGTSTGIGYAIAMRLLREGVSVFAGVRRPVDGDRLATAATSSESGTCECRLIPLILDVTRESDMQMAIERVTETVGRDGLWALVNNAGIVVPGPIEHVTADEWRRQFEVNFFSVAELIRLALPLLRLAVLAHGFGVPRIMIVSSIGGRVAQPLIAPYTSSKWAVTALGDSLRMELRRHGIGVTVLEPGAIATAIWKKGDRQSQEIAEDHPAMKHYSQEIDGLVQVSRRIARSAITADRAAEIAVRSLIRRRAPARVLVGQDAKVIAFLRWALPTSWFDAILRQQFGIPKEPPAPGGRSPHWPSQQQS